MPQRVIVYHQPGCPSCDQEMAWLLSNAIPFEKRDVTANLQWLDEVIDLGGNATPVTLIQWDDREQVVFGFNRPQLEALLRSPE